MNKEEYKEQFGILLTENSELKKTILRLETELADLKVEFLDNGGEQKTIDYNEKQSKMIFESPDGGETVYGRRFNEYKNRTLIKDPRDISKYE